MKKELPVFRIIFIAMSFIAFPSPSLFGQENVVYLPEADSIIEIGDTLEIDLCFGTSGRPFLKPGNCLDSFKYLVDILERNPELIIEIAVHTDHRGAEKDNFHYSQYKADQIKGVLVEIYNIQANRLEAKGYGESRLRVSIDEIEKEANPELKEILHAKNRRVEVIIKGLAANK